MRRDLRTYNMSYRDRQAYAAKRKAQIANDKQAKVDTLDRLKETVRVIEEAFQPEADRLFKNVVAAWTHAWKNVYQYGGKLNDMRTTYNAVRTGMLGRDFEATPIPVFKGVKYTDRGLRSKAYLDYKEQVEPLEALMASFDPSMEATIIRGSYYSKTRFDEFANSEATKEVEANKAKLLSGVARYLAEFKTVTVTGKESVKASVKGFQGVFYLWTDKGPKLFDCKAITAEGPIVSFHWRFIIHVKDIKPGK